MGSRGLGPRFRAIFFSNIWKSIGCRGMTPLAWSPQAYRSLGSSIGMGVARMTSALVALTYLTVAEVLTQGGSFALFSVMAFFGTSFMIFYLPETKGTTLESVNKLLS